MLLKIEKYHHNNIMNFNFFFISYSVIYAKYNYCYEVPRDQPLRYFDGKEWKLMKPRHNIRTKAPRHSSISVDLDWAEIIKEIKESEFEETTTEMPSCGVSITDTPTTTKKATAKRLSIKKIITKRQHTKKIVIKRPNTKNLANKKTIAKKITTKIAATPKMIFNPLRRKTQLTTAAKAISKHSRPVCKLKLKSATTTTIDPQLLHLKMTTSGDWRDSWNFLRPTKKYSPVTSNKFTLKATKVFVLQTIKKVTVATTRKLTTATKRPVTTTRKSTTTTKRPVTSTMKPTMPTIGTMTVTMKPLIKTEMPVKFAGNQEDEANSPANWSNLLKEFLKFVESKKCQRPPCESVSATTTKPYSGYQLAENRKIMSDDDDLMNILMDGVEIDDRLNEEDDDATQIKDTLEYEGRRLNYESVEGSVSRDSEINNDYVQLLDLELLKDSIETRRGTAQIPKKMRYLREFQEKNVKNDSVPSHIRESEVYVDILRDNSSNEDDDFLENELKSHSDELKANLAEKEYLTYSIKRSEADSDELKDKNTKNEDEVVQGIEAKAYSDALKDMRANKNYMFSGRGSEVHSISQNSKTKSYLDALLDKRTTKEYLFSGIKEPKLYLDEVKGKIVQKEDEILQANDIIKLNSDEIKGIHDKKDYETSRIRKSEMNSNKLKIKNTQKEDKVIDDSEIKFYINALKNKHAKKGNEPSEVIEKRKKYLDVENSKQQDKVNLEDESTETFNSKELSEITDYMASKPTYPIKLRSQTKNEDGLQDSDITFD